MEEKEIVLTIATEVMGWERHENTYFWQGDNGNFFDSSLWNPLQNIADAWQVLKRLEAIGWEWEMKAASYLHPSIKLTHGVTLRKIFAHGDDEAKTICNAAMKVVA